MPNQEQQIYQEQIVKIIAPIKARIFSEDFERIEAYDENQQKVILFIKKQPPLKD